MGDFKLNEILFEGLLLAGCERHNRRGGCPRRHDVRDSILVIQSRGARALADVVLTGLPQLEEQPGRIVFGPQPPTMQQPEVPRDEQLDLVRMAPAAQERVPDVDGQ